MMIDPRERSVTPTQWEGGVSCTVYLFFLMNVILPFLQNLYDSIKNEPFKIPEDDGNDLTHTFFNPDREGWLLKLGMCVNGHDIRLWRRGLCVAGDKCLFICYLIMYELTNLYNK